MLIHACGSEVAITSSLRVRVVMAHAYCGDVVTVVATSPRIESGRGNGIELACEKCGQVSPLAVTESCMHCGNRFSLNDLFLPIETGGVYCSTCCSKLGLSRGETLLNQLQEKIKGGSNI